MFRKHVEAANIFPNRFCHLLENIGIEITGIGHTAKIVLFENKDKTDITLRVNHAKHLKKEKYFQSAIEQPEEVLVNTWNCRRGYGWLAKYNAERKSSVVIISDSAEEDLNKLLNFIEPFKKVDYFREKYFCHLLKTKCKLSMIELRNIPGMSGELIQLFSDNVLKLKELLDLGVTLQDFLRVDLNAADIILQANTETFKKSLLLLQAGLFSLPCDKLALLFLHFKEIEGLMKKGLTIAELRKVDSSRLECYLKHSVALAGALELVTVQQVFHLDESQPVINNKKIIDKEAFIWGEFSCEYSKQEYHLTHTGEDKSTTAFKLISGHPTDQELAKLNQSIEGKKPISKVFDWYKIDQNIHDQKMFVSYYCPTLKLLVQEARDHSFPMHGVKTDKELKEILRPAPFYQEDEFCEFLKKQHYSVEQVKKLEGMTNEKLWLLTSNLTAVSSLVRCGISIADFAKVTEDQLRSVLTSYEQNKVLLNFMSPQHLLGLDQQKSEKKHGLFQFWPKTTEKTEEAKEEKHEHECSETLTKALNP